MNKNVVFLDDPTDDMHGELSPEYETMFHTLFLGQMKTFKSNIISYTYAGLFGERDIEYQSILAAHPRKAYQEAMDSFRERQYKLFQESFVKMYKKLIKNPISLLETGASQLMYIQKQSSGKYETVLGVDEKTKGSNMIGKSLMKLRSEIRHELMKMFEDEQKDMSVLSTVSAVYYHLRDLISKGVDTLQKYIGRNPFEIARELKLDVKPIVYLADLQPFVQNIIPENDEEREDVVKLVRANMYNIAFVLRKQYETVFNETRVNRNKESIALNYIHSVSPSTQKPDEVVRHIGSEAYEEFKNRLYELYLFNRDLLFQGKQQYNVDTSLVMSQNDIWLRVDPVYREQLKKSVYTQIERAPLPVSPNYLIVPYQVVEMDDLYYPTPLHYCYAKMMEKLNDNHLTPYNKVAVHKMLMINSKGNVQDLKNYKRIEDIASMYERMVKDHISYTIEDRLEKGLYQKFEDETYARLLAGTGNKRLIYNSAKDFVLGTGPVDYAKLSYKGRNMVGSIMERVRKELQIDDVDPLIRMKMDILPFPSDDIFKEIFEEEPFESVKGWVFNQMREISNLIVNLKAYESEKYKINNQNVTIEEISFIIQKVYSVCHILEQIIDMNKLKWFLQRGVPSDVKEELNRVFTRNKIRISESMMKKIWSYMLVLMLSIKLDGGLILNNFDSHIDKLARKKFQDTVCTLNMLYNINDEREKQKMMDLIDPKSLKDKEYKNCIAQAMINLIKQIKLHHIESSQGPYILEEIDIEFIFSIMSYYAGRELANPEIVNVASPNDFTTILELFKRNGIDIKDNNVANKFYKYMDALAKGSSDTRYRVIYFANEPEIPQQKKKKKTKKQIQDDKDYQEWLLQRLERPVEEEHPVVQPQPVENVQNVQKSFKKPVKRLRPIVE
jgi:predicted NAD-dependent protein-ADP-ribosyltransferase YbiA (DUF1768 family)